MLATRSSPPAFQLRFLCLAIFLAAFSACSSLFSGSEDPDAFRELSDLRRAGVGTHKEFSERQEAMTLYGLGQYGGASAAFERLRDAYPMSTFAEFYRVKAADAYFELGRYEDAAVLYQELFETGARSAARPYFALRAGESHLRSFRGMGRDIGPVQKALISLRDARNIAPSAEFASEVQTLLADAQTKLEQYEMEVVNFYRRAGNIEAAEARLARLEHSADRLDGQPLRLMSLSCLSNPIETLVLEFNRSPGAGELRAAEAGGEPEFTLGPIFHDASGTEMIRGCAFVLRRSDVAGDGQSLLHVTLREEGSRSVRVLPLSDPPRVFLFPDGDNTTDSRPIGARR